LLLLSISSSKFSFANEFISFNSEDFSFSDKINNTYQNELNIINNLNIGLDDNQLEKIIQEKLKQPNWEYKVRKGDSLWSISKKFNVKIEDILILNNLSSEKDLKYGMKIKIPGNRVAIIEKQNNPKKLLFNLKGKYVTALTSISGLAVPVSGYNWGEKHMNNASDIAAPCGEPVYAAASGYVAISQDGWNNGYGNYIVIYHEKYSTLYAHLSLRTVNEGEYVEKGDLIGYVGNTGYVKGLTGCHLHFEVRGRENPLLY